MRELALASLEVENGPYVSHVSQVLWQVHSVLLQEMGPNNHIFLKKEQMLWKEELTIKMGFKGFSLS